MNSMWEQNTEENIWARTLYLTVKRSKLREFISVFNQLDAQNLFHNKFYFMPLHVSSTCTHHQEVKIALPSGLQVANCKPDGHLQRILYQMLY